MRITYAIKRSFCEAKILGKFAGFSLLITVSVLNEVKARTSTPYRIGKSKPLVLKSIISFNFSISSLEYPNSPPKIRPFIFLNMPNSLKSAKKPSIFDKDLL